MLYGARTSGHTWGEARMAFLMPPEDPRGPEAPPINSEAVAPPFNIENTEATTGQEVQRATQEQLQAKTKLITAAFNTFNTGLANFKDSYAKQIKEAVANGDPELANKLTAERDQRVTKIIADVNARLAELSNTRGFPSYRVVQQGENISLATGETGRVDLQNALRNVPEGLKKKIMNMPPAEQEVFARTLSVMTPEQLTAAAPVLTDALRRVEGMNAIQRQAVIAGLLNPGTTPDQLVKTFRLNPAQARAVNEFFTAVNANPAARDVLKRHLEACQNVVASGAANGSEIPANNPARTAEILSAIGAPALTPQQVGNIRVALANYVEKIGGNPDATEGDRDIEKGNLMMMGVNPDARVDGFMTLNQVCDKMRANEPIGGKLAVRTVHPRDLGGMQLMGALTFLSGFVNKLSKDDKPLNRPNTNPQNNADRQKRISEIDQTIKRNEEEIKKLNAELVGPPAPNEKRAKEIRERISKLEKDNKSLAAERERLQKEVAQNPNAEQIAKIDKTIKANEEEIKKLTARIDGPPPLPAAEVKALTEQRTKLENQNKELRQQREKLQKEGNTPPPPGPGPEGPRLPHTPENREALQKASDEAQKTLDNAIASGTDHTATIQAYDRAIGAYENEAAHLQEYANPDAVSPGRLKTVVDKIGTLREMRTSTDGPIWKKGEQDLTQAHSMPETDNPAKLRKFDAVATALRTQLAFLQRYYPTVPALQAPYATELSQVLRDRAAIEPPLPHTPETREKFSKETDVAKKALANAIASGTDAPAILRGYDNAINAMQAELVHLAGYQVPDVPVAGEPALNTQIRAQKLTLASDIATAQRGKVEAISTQLQAASTTAEGMPQTDNPAKLRRLDAMVTAYRNELIHRQDHYSAGSARIVELETNIADARRARAALPTT